MSNLFFGKSINGEMVHSNKKALYEFLIKRNNADFYHKIWWMTKQRTATQNDALHKYYELLAKELNDAGWTVQKLLQHTIEIDWTKDTVKELLWRPVQKLLTGKPSTTNLDKTSEIDLVYEHINRYVGETTGIHMPFPSEANKL